MYDALLCLLNYLMRLVVGVFTADPCMTYKGGHVCRTEHIHVLFTLTIISD